MFGNVILTTLLSSLPVQGLLDHYNIASQKYIIFEQFPIKLLKGC